MKQVDNANERWIVSSCSSWEANRGYTSYWPLKEREKVYPEYKEKWRRIEIYVNVTKFVVFEANFIIVGIFSFQWTKGKICWG